MATPSIPLETSELLSSSTHSFGHRLESRSDPSFNRRVKTAEPFHSRSELSLSTSSRPPSRPMTRERLNQLAQPKGARAHSSKEAGRPWKARTENRSDMRSSIPFVVPAPIHDKPPPSREKPASVVEDRRFHRLIDSCCDMYESHTPKTRTIQSIVRSNAALHGNRGRWRTINNSIMNSRSDLQRHRPALVHQFHKAVDVFLIDVGA